jgi:hypothetical protein
MTKKSEKKEKKVNFKDLANKIAKYMKDGKENLLKLVKIKGNGVAYYYSVSDSSFVLMPKTAEMYLLPWKKDEKNRLFVFSPYIFSSGIIIMVPEDEIEIIGFN